MLLPEAEHIVELSKTLTHQSEHLERSTADIARLKRDRRLIKTGGSTDYPGNLEVSLRYRSDVDRLETDLPRLMRDRNVTGKRTALGQQPQPALDPSLSSLLRLGQRA